MCVAMYVLCRQEPVLSTDSVGVASAYTGLAQELVEHGHRQLRGTSGIMLQLHKELPLVGAVADRYGSELILARIVGLLDCLYVHRILHPMLMHR